MSLLAWLNFVRSKQLPAEGAGDVSKASDKLLDSSDTADQADKELAQCQQHFESLALCRRGHWEAA